MTTKKHLIVIQNGLNGLAFSMRSVKSFFEEALPDSEYRIIVSPINDLLHTWWGIDYCGQRLANFVKEQSDNVDRISVLENNLTFFTNKSEL